MCMDRLVELHLWFLLCNLWWACFNPERLTHLFAVKVGILCHVTFEGFFGWSRKHTWITSIIQNQTRTILNIYIKKYNSTTECKWPSQTPGSSWHVKGFSGRVAPVENHILSKAQLPSASADIARIGEPHAHGAWVFVGLAAPVLGGCWLGLGDFRDEAHKATFRWKARCASGIRMLDLYLSMIIFI